MIVDKNSYEEIQKDIILYSKELVTQDELESFNKHITLKLLDFTPTLMIYGTYNAGKSTLLNALFGQDELAKTGDAPETKDVHEYKYNSYTIYDTPGLNARSEDDIVTKEHLAKSEVILFVISNNGSLEEDYVYDKISEVVKAKKPTILVLNNKNGIDQYSVEAKNSMIKVGENLRKIGDRNGVENIETKVSLCMINAKTALKAKLENKNLILKKSNILQLETMIEKLLNDSGNKEVINALNIYIQNFINNIVSKIDNKINNVEVQKTEELITYLEKFKQSSEVKLKNIVNKKTSSMIDTIASMLLSGSQSLEDDVDTYISQTVSDINSKAMDIYINIESNLKVKIDDFSKEFQSLNADYSGISNDSKSDQIKDDFYISDDIKNKIGGALKDKKVLEESTKQILTKAKDWLPKEVMFGKGPVWINKAAGKAAIGLSVAIEAYSMYRANKEYQDMIEEQRDRTIGAKDSATTIVDNIESSLFTSIDEMIADTFNELIIGFKDISKSLNSDNSELIQKKENLISLSQKL
ncbi:hypothetical protein CRU96_02660 [Malaciobacter halophilus]|nr:GTPase [Malaciobacter halophilus]RYA24553.1 hypothetical protein CRU96_02660 [Malaciobacter halophilus]